MNALRVVGGAVKVVDGARTPRPLKTASEVAPAAGLRPERLLSLAEAGYCPHYRIDGGEPLFIASEVKRWVWENLVEQVMGGEVPFTVKVASVVSAYDAGATAPPLSIGSIPNLLSLPTSVPPGVYFLCMGDEVVYVGQSINALSRLGGHAQKKFDRAYLLPVPVEHLNRVEGAFIRALRPKLTGWGPIVADEDVDGILDMFTNGDRRRLERTVT